MVFDNVMDSGMDKPIRYTQFELWNLFVEWGQRRTIFDKITFGRDSEIRVENDQFSSANLLI